MKVRIERPTQDLWHVEYQLPTPAEGLLFPRNTNLFRKDQWRIKSHGLELFEEDRYEVVRATNGSLIRKVAFEFGNVSNPLKKDYELLLPFTDGGALIYTGHLRVSALPQTHHSFELEITYVPQPNGHVLMNGEVFSSPQTVSYTDPGFGTYVYFGTAEPVETDDMLALVDPGLPIWIQTATNNFLPKLLHYYASRTGVPMTSKPMVFFSFDSGRAGEYSYSGGTLQGPLAQLAVSGSGWNEEDRDTNGPFGALLRFVAHESAHLWNSQLVENQTEPFAAWMHEGGADAFAFRALQELELIDLSLRERWQLDALDECSACLKEGTIHSSAERRQYRNYYACGSTIAWLTELSLPPGKDLFDFWQRLFSKATASGVPYTEELYFETLEELTVKQNIVGELRTLIYEQQDNPSIELIEIFKKTDQHIQFDPDTNSFSLVK